MEKFDTQFFKKTLGPMAIQMSGYGIQYLFLIIVSHTLTVSQFGTISYAIVINTLLATLIALGTDSNSKHFFALYIREKAFKKITIYIAWNIKLVLRPVSISLLLFCILFFIIDPFELLFERHLSETTKIITSLTLTAPFFAISNILSSYLLCDNKIKLYIYFFTVQAFLIMTLLTLAPAYFGLFTPSVNYILMAMILASIINALTTCLAIKRFSPQIYNTVHNLVLSPELLSKMKVWDQQTRLQLINNFLNAAMIKIDYIILIFFATSHDLGIYSVATNTSFVLPNITVGLFSFIVPMISSMINKKSSRAELQATWNQALKLNTFILFFFWLGLIVFAKQVVLGIYGPSYLESTSLLQILATTYLITSIPGSKGYLLAYSRNVNYSIKGYILRITMCIIFACFLHDYGMQGIAMSALLSEICRTVFLIFIIKRKTGFKVFGII